MLYSEEDIISNVQQFNNIIDDDNFLNLKNVIINSHDLKSDNIFIKNQHYINLFENKYVTETIFNIIKTKFNYQGILENVICKIQSHIDYEDYHTISNDINSTVFSLDINTNTYYNLIYSDVCNIISATRSATRPDTDISNNICTFNNTDLLNIPDLNNRFLREFYLEKQNLLDNQGYLSFIPSYTSDVGICYEHINNNCIKFPGYFIHKMKPYMKFSKSNRISLLFICKNT
jgi:hypothetical protein